MKLVRKTGRNQKFYLKVLKYLVFLILLEKIDFAGSEVPSFSDSETPVFFYFGSEKHGFSEFRNIDFF